jgi:hypothetical protein
VDSEEVSEVEEVREVEDVRKKCLSEEEKGFGIPSTQYPVSQFPISCICVVVKFKRRETEKQGKQGGRDGPEV